MHNVTPEQIDTAFPGHRDAAAKDGIHPDFHDTYIPLGADRTPFTKGQKDLLFPSRAAVMRDIIQSVTPERPACPHCGNWDVDCICDQIGEKAS